MPAPRKSLDDLIADRSFLARRKHHRELLEGRLVHDPTLRTIQLAYQQEESEAERYVLARQFQSAVQTGTPVPGPTLAHLLHASLGPNPRALEGRISRKELERLDVEWQAWDFVYGLAWRAQNDLLNNVDLCALVEGRLDVARVDTNRRLPREDELPELLQRFWAAWEGERPQRDLVWREWREKRGYEELVGDEIPAPPGYELIRV